MARLKKPDLSPGPQKELNDAIHDLHTRAGLPSTRDLSKAVGAAVASKSRIHDVFSSTRLPAWGLLELLVEALANRTPGGYTDEDERRFHDLWLATLGQTVATSLSHREPLTDESADGTSTVPTSTCGLLLVRVEWLNPTAMEMNHRRWLRRYIDQALEDIGHPSGGLHRRDRSAGSLLFIEPSGEPAGLLASTLLASLDSAMKDDWGDSGRLVRNYDDPRALACAFCPTWGSATLSGLNYEGHAVTELNNYWELGLVRGAVAAPGEIAAIVSAHVYDSAFFPERRQQEWRPPLRWSHRTVPQAKADGESICLFVREEGPLKDPWDKQA